MGWNEGIAVSVLAALAGAVWRVVVWVGKRVEKYLDHRMASEAKLVEHVGEIAASVVVTGQQVIDNSRLLTDIHSIIVRKPEAGCTQTTASAVEPSVAAGPK